MRRTASTGSRSHSRTVSSKLPLARVFPFGLKATAPTMPVPASRGRVAGTGCAGSVTFHRMGQAVPAALGEGVSVRAEHH